MKQLHVSVRKMSTNWSPKWKSDNGWQETGLGLMMGGTPSAVKQVETPDKEVMNQPGDEDQENKLGRNQDRREKRTSWGDECHMVAETGTGQWPAR